MPGFPLFVNLEKRSCLVVGGGRVALRKIKTLMQYTQNIKVIAPYVAEEIKAVNVDYSEREFESDDILGQFLVIAATDNRLVNHLVAMLCKDKGIFINSATDADDCDFYFPASIVCDDISIGISTTGKSPVISRLIRQKISEKIPENLGGISDRISEYRNIIKERIPTENRRKATVRIADMLIENSDISDNEIMDIIKSYER